MSLQRLNLIVTEVMKKYNIEGFSIDKEGACTLVFDDDELPNVNFYYDDNLDSVLIFADVGYVKFDEEAQILRALLEKNLFWAGSKGCVFSVSHETGVVMLQVRLEVETLTNEGLENALSNFFDVLDDTRNELFSDKIANEEQTLNTPNFIQNGFGNYIMES